MYCLISQVQYRRRFRYTGDISDHMFTITNFRPPLHRTITAESLSTQFGSLWTQLPYNVWQADYVWFPGKVLPAVIEPLSEWKRPGGGAELSCPCTIDVSSVCMAVSSPSTWRRDLVHGRTDNNFTILVSYLCINHNPPTLAETMRVGLVLKARAGSSDASELCVALHIEFVRNPSWAFRLIQFWMASV